MNRLKLTMAVTLLLAVPGFAGAGPKDAFEGPSKSFEPSAAKFDPAAHYEEMTKLQRRLNSSMVGIALSSPLQILVTPEERENLRPERLEAQKLKVGLVRELDIPISFDRQLVAIDQEQLHQAVGAVRGTAGGGFDWTARVVSPEAAALRIHFTDFDLPAGSELYVFSFDGAAFGPYSGKGPNGTGDFWTNTIPGSDMIVQLHAGLSGNPSFRIAGAAHLTPEFKIASSIAPPSEVSPFNNCSFNASCVTGVNCPEATVNETAVAAARDAVAHILFPSGGGMYICSGGLVADSDTSTTIPYFITANHCISTSSEAGGMETFFFYEKNCGDCARPTSRSTLGSTVVSTSSTSDYTLLRLSQEEPTGAAFLGWNSTAVANTNGAALYRISHPGGAPQSYSEHVVDTSKGTCGSWPRGNWIYSRDTEGATEGGSSGSPVVNASGQLVGQLSGACGTNVNNNCDAVRNATVDGAFAAYFSKVSSYLGSTPTNVAPSANFTFSTSGLTASFTDTSTDSDGTITGRNWNFGDTTTSTATNPSKTYAASGTYNVTLTVTDDDGATGSISKSVTVTAGSTGGITLNVTGRKVKGNQTADLTWSGATTTSVDIYRNNVKIVTTPNDGAHTDNINKKGGGSYTYRLCNAGTTTCSPNVIISF